MSHSIGSKAGPSRGGVMPIVAARHADGWRIVAAQHTAIVPRP